MVEVDELTNSQLPPLFVVGVAVNVVPVPAVRLSDWAAGDPAPGCAANVKLVGEKVTPPTTATTTGITNGLLAAPGEEIVKVPVFNPGLSDAAFTSTAKYA